MSLIIVEASFNGFRSQPLKKPLFLVHCGGNGSIDGGFFLKLDAHFVFFEIP